MHKGSFEEIRTDFFREPGGEEVLALRGEERAYVRFTTKVSILRVGEVIYVHGFALSIPNTW
jgi:hypothetical protein